MKKVILNYGLISGAIAAALMTGTAIYFSNSGNTSNGELIGYTGIFLSMVFVFLGVKAYRDQELGGAISFGKAFQVGILISIISCLCYVIAWMVVYETILPDFMDKFITQSLEKMREAGESAEKISQHAQEMEAFKVQYQNPLFRFAMTFLEPFPVALLVTLVSAVILRRNPAA